MRRTLLVLVVVGLLGGCTDSDPETLREVVDRTLEARTMRIETTSGTGADRSYGLLEFQAPDRTRGTDADGAITSLGVGRRTYVPFCARWASSTRATAVGRARPATFLRALLRRPVRRTAKGFAVDFGKAGSVEVTVSDGRVRTVTMPDGDGATVTDRYSAFDRPIPPITAPDPKYVDEAGKDGQLELLELGFTSKPGHGVSCTPGSGAPDPQLFAPKRVG